MFDSWKINPMQSRTLVEHCGRKGIGKHLQACWGSPKYPYNDMIADE
jgi:hypothetical protein